VISSTDIMDRHNRAVAGLGEGGGITVRILAGTLTRQADQQLLACLINLLCRMPGSVDAITLDAPDAVLTVALPDGQSPDRAFDRLSRFARWAVGDAVPVLRTLESDPTFTISIDPTAPAEEVDLYVAGAGWIAWIGTVAPSLTLVDTSNPIGPWFAACLAAGEVFKRARGLKRGQFAQQDEGYALWDGTTGPLTELRDGPSLDGAMLPPFFMVGAGAVGQGVVALLGASQIESFVVTIDDDVHDGTNLNRCFIAGEADVGHAKVDAVARYRSIAKLAGAEFLGTLQQFQLHGPLAEMPAAMQASQADEKFDIVVSAVDKNTSRWDLQGLAPGLIVGGSTDQLTAKAMTYGASHGDPCLACHNPREEDGARRRELEHRIRGLADTEARALLSRLDIGNTEIEAVLEYVRDAPICGSLGDQILGGLATASPREFSVSFVSMAAAVLAFVRLLQAGCFAGLAPIRPMMSSVAFRNLSYSDDGLSLDPTCPFCQGANVDTGG
jgi:molybdopterin/thiamine biosynthesis adenylyltransferase